MADERAQLVRATREGHRQLNAALTEYEKELDAQFAAEFATVLKHCASQQVNKKTKVCIGPDHGTWGLHASDYLRGRFEDAGCSVEPFTRYSFSKGRRLVIWCPGVKH